MARITKQLTVKQINDAKANGEIQKLYDGAGLILQVSKTGLKTWYLKYKRPHDGKEDMVRIGRYPEIGLLMARDIRLELASLLEQGIDPKQHKEQQERERQNKLLLGDVVPRYLEHRAITNKPNTIKSDSVRF